MSELQDYHPRARLVLAGLILRQAVDDAAEGVRRGLLHPTTLKPIRRIKVESAHDNPHSGEIDFLRGALFLHDWRGQMCCDLIERCSPKAFVSPRFLRGRAASIARDGAQAINASRRAETLEDEDAEPGPDPVPADAPATAPWTWASRDAASTPLS